MGIKLYYQIYVFSFKFKLLFDYKNNSYFNQIINFFDSFLCGFKIRYLFLPSCMCRVLKDVCE